MAIYQRGKSYYCDFVYKGQRDTGCIGPVSRTVAKETGIDPDTSFLPHTSR